MLDSPANTPSSLPRLNWLELLGGPSDDTGFVLTSGGDGSIYLGGETNGGSWDGQTARGRRDGFVSRYNLAGQRLWTQWYGSNQDDQVRGLGVDPYGALYLSGGTLGGLGDNSTPTPSAAASDGFLSRINSSGQKDWTLQLGGDSWDLLRSLAVSPSDGAIYGIGYTASLSFSLLPSRPTQETPPDAFVIKADAARNVIWATRIGSSNQDYVMNLAIGNDGFIYVTGFSGDSNTTSPARGFLRKLKASDGTVVYTRIIGDAIAGNSYGEDLSIGIDGAIYVAISTDGNLGGNTNQGNRDVAVQKYDQNGNLIWTVLHGTSAKEEARTITTAQDGSVYLTGQTSGNLGGQINNGGEDAFITKISENGIIQWTKLLGTAGNDVGWSVTPAGNNSLIVSGLTNGNLEGRTSNGGQDIFMASLDISEPATPSSVSVSLNRTSVREQDQERLLFSFSRTGSLVEPLSISYSLGGTASQADYSGAVPGAAQRFIIPAGVRSADLTLSPVVDGLVEGDESVELRLNPDTAYSIATAEPLKATLIGELNHDPIATFGAKLSVRVGAAILDGKLSSTDQESGDQAYFRLLRSAPAGFVLQDNGTWSFNPQDPQVLSIPAGERRSSSVVYKVEDRVPTSQPSLPQGVVRVGGANAQFATIQAALDQASAGAVLLVAAGVYDERLTIDKDVTILGANFGIPADDLSRGNSSGESVIRGYLNVAANVNDFNLDGVTLLGDPARGVNMRVQAASSRLSNTIITAVRPPGGYADFAYVKYTRDAGLPAYTNITVENNVFNGNVDFNATPVVLQLNNSKSIQVSHNTFLDTGGGGNIVLAGDSGTIGIKNNLILGGGKGIATYNGGIEKLEIVNNTILDTNLNGIDLNFNSILKSGLIEGNLVQGSGINRTNQAVTSANLSVSPQAELWSDFRIGNNNLTNPFGSNSAYQGFIPAGLTNATLQPSSVGTLTLEVEAQAPSKPAAALPLARSSDATSFRVSRFATDLGFPSSFAELSDGALLAAVTLGDPANRSPFGSTPSQLVRLVDSNHDGVSDSKQVLATVPGFVTSLRRCGNLIFALSSGRQTISPTLTILRTGATASAPLVEEAVLRFQFPQAYLTATNPHSSYALAVRSSATVANGVELFFNLGPLEENRSTDPALTIGLSGNGDVEFAPAQMAPDSIQRILISDQGDKLNIGAPLMVASGVRNAAGISFDRNGNLIFQDNGFSDPPNTEFTLSSDELNRINADELGRTVPDFGFSESYVRISDGVIVNPSPSYREPLVSFLPLNGRKSEGAVEVSIAPSGFPSEFIDTVFTTFFGKFGVGTAKNDENPVVAANPETGTYYHFINSAQIGNPSALLAAGGSLYLGDYSKTGFFFGPGADTAGAIYRITPVQPPRFRNLPLLQQAGSSSASLAWSIDADAISSLELWGGTILAQAPRLYTLTPQPSGLEFMTSAVLQDLQSDTTYFYRVRLGDQVCEASFTTSVGAPPMVSLAIAEPSVTEDGQAALRYLFSRSGDITSALTVNYTVGGTANLGVDFTGIAPTPATKTITFAAGSATATVTVDPTVDSEIEPEETVALTLAAGTGYTVSTTVAVIGTITPAPYVPGPVTVAGVNLGKIQLGYALKKGSWTPISITNAGAIATETGGWRALAAAATGNGYDLYWKNINGLVAKWSLNSSASLTSASVISTADFLQAESSLVTDLDGDGNIGFSFAVAKTIGSVQFGSSQVGYALQNGSNPVLSITNAGAVAAEAGGWRALAAAASGNGYDLYWKNINGLVAKWSLNSSASLTSASVISTADFLQAESSLVTDLDGDGNIGFSFAAAKTIGSVQFGSSPFGYALQNGSNPVLSITNAGAVASEAGGWTALAAAASGNGYNLYWKNSNGLFAQWNLNSSASLTSAFVISAADFLQAESSLATDLDGDGNTGLPFSAVKTIGSVQFGSSPFGYALQNGSNPVLSITNAGAVAAEAGGWTALAAAASGNGYDLYWKHNNGMVAKWILNSSAELTSAFVISMADFLQAEINLATDLDSDFPSTNAFQLARSIDDSRFSVSRYATGLTFPTSMTELADRSILVAENKNENGNLIRLMDSNSDGISDSQTTLASLPGLISSVRRTGNLIFTISPFQGNNRAVISIWRTGQVSGNQSSDSLQLAGKINLDYPVRFLHFTFALALRPNPQQPGVIDIFFNVGSQNDSTATDPNLRVAINADSGATIPSAQMEPDSIQQISVRDLGNKLEVTSPKIIARGLRNAAGITFDAKGNLIFVDNGIDVDPSGLIPSSSKAFSADELNMIAANEIGSVVPHFGFPANYVRSDSGLVVNPSPNFRFPLATFLPLNGSKSEGAVEVAMAPVGFPGEFINTSFTNFFGIGNNAFNDENALVATDTSTGSYFHFINPNVLGMGTGALSTQNALYFSDRSLRLGTGSIYKIYPKIQSVLTSTPELSNVNGTPQLNWLTNSDAITSLEVWGGSIPSSTPRISTYRPIPTGAAHQFATSAPLDQLQRSVTYDFKIQVGEHSNSGTFTIPAWNYNWTDATPLANTPSILRASVNMPSPRIGEAPLALTALRINLQDPAISLTSTGRASGWTNNSIETSSQTTRQFISNARSNGQPVVAAINAAPFDLNIGNQLQSGPTNIRGFAVSEGQLISSFDYNGDTFKSTFLYDPITGARIENIPNTLLAAPDLEVSFAATLKVATSGFGIVLNNGQVTGDTTLQNARSGLGLSADRRYLTLVAVDRQPNASQPSGWQGATDFDMGQILRGFGAADGMLLDGGGSTQLAWWNGDLAQAELLSNPLSERYVGSSLGVTYRPLG